VGPAVTEPFRVLIVDVEGIGRAPAGERFLRRELAARGIETDLIQVDSAGLDATDGEPMHPRTAKALEDRGVDSSGYVQRTLSREILAGVDMIVCGNGADRDEVVRRFPAAKKKAFSLSEIFYLYELVVAIAPLREHPALLSSRVADANLANDFDLPPLTDDPDEYEARIELLADQIQRAAFWIGTIWESMLPENAAHRPAPQAGDRFVDLVAFGVTVRVVCHGDAPFTLATLVERTWLWLLAPVEHEAEPEVTISIAVFHDDAARVQARSEGWLTYDSMTQAMHFLSSTVTVRAIDARAGTLVMLHAAGISTEDGRVVGFVAPSGTGKTTLARTLGRHYGYVTDETLAIQFDGTVLAYPKPLSVITNRVARLKEQQPAHDLGLQPAPDRLRLARVILLDRRPDAPAFPELQPVTLLRGMAELAEQTSYLPHLPDRLETLADLIESVGGIWRLSYRESEDLVTFVPWLAEGR
jgi:protein-tyrosine-phosphatase